MSYKIGQLISSEQQSTKQRVNTIKGEFLRSQLSIRYNLYESATSVKYDAFYLGDSLEAGNGYIFSLETTTTKIPTSCSIYIGYIENKSVTEISMNKMQWICDYNSTNTNNVGIIKSGINAKMRANCILIKHNENKFDKICLREISKINPLNDKQEYERIGVRVPNNNHSFLPCIMVNNELITLYSQDQNIFYETTGNVKVQSIGVAYFDKNETDKSKVTSGIINNDQAKLNKFNYYIDYLYKIV